LWDKKINPTGFRIGVNKPHISQWYVNQNSYPAVLKEDYQIRKFFEKEWSIFYDKAGISKLEIKRKVRQIELLVHAARPKVIANGCDTEYTFETLRNKLGFILSTPKQIRIKVVQIAKMETDSYLIARSLADQLEKRVAFRRAIRQVSQRLEKSGVSGFKIQVSGRLNGAEMARAEWVREGRVPLQTLRANISYATYRAYTTYGVLGIKVWIFNN
jgi:small subunit ribosomal protein S3